MKRLVISAALLLLPLTAIAQTCGPREIVITTLQENYNEVRVGVAMTSDNNLVEVFASETGSWTLLVTTPNGVSCISLHGYNYESVVEHLPPNL